MPGIDGAIAGAGLQALDHAILVREHRDDQVVAARVQRAVLADQLTAVTVRQPRVDERGIHRLALQSLPGRREGVGGQDRPVGRRCAHVSDQAIPLMAIVLNDQKGIHRTSGKTRSVPNGPPG